MAKYVCLHTIIILCAYLVHVSTLTKQLIQLVVCNVVLTGMFIKQTTLTNYYVQTAIKLHLSLPRITILSQM